MKIFALRARGYGHRGNTALALRAALRAPIDGVHLDVRLTKDLRWVLGPESQGKKEEREVFRVHTHSRAALGTGHLSLDAALALVAAFGEGKQLLLDVRDAGEERELIATLQRHAVLERTVLLAWDQVTLERVHALAPTLRLGLCVAATHEAARQTHRAMPRRKTSLVFDNAHTFDVSLTAIARTHPTIAIPRVPIAVICIFALSCSTEQVTLLHGRGIEVVAYPVNSSLAKSLLSRQKVDAILTSEPKSLL